MNLLILAVLDLSIDSRGRMLSREAAAHALSGSVSAGLMCLIALGLLKNKWLSTHAILGTSPVIFAVVLSYLLGVRLTFLDQRIAQRSATEKGVPVHEPPAGLTLGKALAGFATCAAAILIAGPFLAHAADELAVTTGLGGTFVGTTLVAFSTSLPELVSSFAALRMGAHDLAIGNIFGSNAFNMILLLPLDLVHPGPLFAAISPIHAITCGTLYS
jgi:cation:H+ antiporter